MGRALRGLALGLALALALGAGALLGWRALAANMAQPAANAAPVRIEVPPGAPLRGILSRLQQQGALSHARWVELYLRLRSQSPRAQAGRYEIAPHATPSQIITQLAQGRVLLASITVVEGWSFAQMRAALDHDADVSHQLLGLSDQQLMSALGHPGQAPEGRFFPDTYRFAAGTPDRKILQMAYQRMQSTLADDWAQRAADLPVTNPYQALILASIVEKETGRPDERPKIAAVFCNRLRLGMRLQSDPTVIYGLGERYDGTIHTVDLTTDTPYNTYTRAGLPPTPIALPGAASLRATLHPADIDALYFVATGDGDGSHHFSATLAEHDRAVRAYLRRLGVTPAAPGDTAAAKPAAPKRAAP
ncbi:MAG: endolytic transglycosylase MltG [Steroidobacteraceae bacterium]